MELLARYLQAVKFWLPREQQEDIAAEIEEDIDSRIEEQEQVLGRKLNDQEITALLRVYGRPFVVANRYGKQEHLVGPTLFPVYRFVLKIVAVFYLVPWLLVLISLTVARHGSMRNIADGLPSFWTLTFTCFGMVTIVFAVLERLPSTSSLLNQWDPRKLPPLRHTGQIKRSSSIAEIIAGLLFTAWWFSGWFSEALLATSGIRLTVTESWQRISWGILLVVAASLALSCMNLLRPNWTRARIYLRLALDCAGSFLFCWLLKAQVISGLSAPQMRDANAAMTVKAINGVMAASLPYAVVACLLIVTLNNAGRLIGEWRSHRTPVVRNANRDPHQARL